MQSSPSIEGYKLPDTVDPVGDLCLTIRIPNDPAYVQAVIGALYDTTIWTSWQRDAAHIGIQAARKMKPRWFEAVQNISNCGEPPRVPGGGLLEDFEMPIRVDCDCNVFITCCDGTEKQILTADQVRAAFQAQPGPGAPQPPPGGCQTFLGSISANGKYLLPVPLNDGDTVLIESVNGAVSDGTFVWFCQSGQIYFAGECISIPILNPLDPLPLTPHMSIIGNFGAGFFPVGTALLTVSGGIVNQQLELSLNWDHALTGGGDFGFSITVCNNQPAPFQHTFDLTLNPGPWAIRDMGIYTAGVGFQDGTVFYSPNTFRGCDIQCLGITPFTMTRLQLFSDDTPGSFGSNSVDFGNVSPGVYFNSVGMSTGPAIYDSGPINIAGVAQLYIDQICGLRNGGDPGGTVLATKIIVSGLGADPF